MLLLSTLIYGGACAFLLCLIGLVPRWLRLRSRGHVAAMMAVCLLLIFIGFAWPPHEMRAAGNTELDHFMPVYQFNEVHTLRVHAPRTEVYRAIKLVTADEIWLFRTLVWIRRAGADAPESLMNPGKRPLLDVATASGFILLADNPDREAVYGAIVAAPPGFRPRDPNRRLQRDDFFTLRLPGFALAAMNFEVTGDGPNACLVRTETRVFATDAATVTRFNRYWRVIYPGSSLIRYSWLRAIQKRAEGG